MKTKTLVKLARHIESVTGQRFNGTIWELWVALKPASDCKTKKEAVKVISEEVYAFPHNGDYPEQEKAMLNF